MRVAGVGVDIVEIGRMRETLLRTPRFRERVFTEDERAWCDRRADPAASYAGCFAAREAVLKALGVGFSEGVGYTDVSVTHDDRGKPEALLSGQAARLAEEQGVSEVFISISHTREVAVANAVASTPASVPAREERRDERAILAAQFKRARSLLDDLDSGKDA
ncbi:MAG: holo-ACP synthase [Coriobacteriales bacterium]|jgi:holo-[acyl-carrier protein] synthase